MRAQRLPLDGGTLGILRRDTPLALLVLLFMSSWV
jgi:hypothetical protein